MPGTLQQFLVTTTAKSVTDLVTALNRIPEEKRNWSPAEGSRSALDMVAEIAINNGVTADLITQRKWTGGDFATYPQRKQALATGNWDDLNALLQKNTQRVIDVIADVPDDTLNEEIVTPIGTFTVAQTISYPYWNMSYHEGQINYIATILGAF